MILPTNLFIAKNVTTMTDIKAEIIKNLNTEIFLYSIYSETKKVSTFACEKLQP